jgi:hypothetical protein
LDQNQIIQRGRPRPVLHVGWGQFSDVAIQKSKSLFDIRKKSHKPNKSDYLQSFGVQNFCWLRGRKFWVNTNCAEERWHAKEGRGLGPSVCRPPLSSHCQLSIRKYVPALRCTSPACPRMFICVHSGIETKKQDPLPSGSTGI